MFANKLRPSILPIGLGDTLLHEPFDFLHVLHQANALEAASPRKNIQAREEIRSLDPSGALLRRIASLGLIRGVETSSPTLTSLGKQVCDEVKQYVNWLEHPADLPRGVTWDMVRGRRVLDVGCGVGGAILTFARGGAASLTGCDLIPTFLALLRIFAAREGLPLPNLACCNGSRLPFADTSFDLVFCRLALNYMPAERAVGEMARVATPGAWLVVILNTLPWELRASWDNARNLRLKSMAFDGFKFFNGLLYHAFGRQLTLRYPGRMMSVYSPVFHTLGGVRRLLTRHGFEALGDDSPSYPHTPAFWAREPSSSS